MPQPHLRGLMHEAGSRAFRTVRSATSAGVAVRTGSAAAGAVFLRRRWFSVQGGDGPLEGGRGRRIRGIGIEGGGVGRPPSQSESSRQRPRPSAFPAHIPWEFMDLTELKRAVTPEEIADIAREEGAWTAEKTASAYQALANLRPCPSKLETISALRPRGIETVNNMSPKHLCRVMACYAKMRRSPDPVYLLQIESRIMQRRRAFEPREVANMLWAFGAMRKLPTRQVLHAFMGKLETSVEEFNIKDLAQTMWSLGSLEIPIGDAISGRLSDHILASVDHLKNQDVSNILWAYARLIDSTPHPSSTLVEALISRGESVSSLMRPQEVSNTLWAAATLVQRVEFDLSCPMLIGWAERMAPYMKNQEIANTLWALAKMDSSPGDALVRRLIGSHQTFNSADVSHVMWAFAKLRQNPGDELMASIIERAVHIADTFKPTEVASVLWSLSQLRQPRDIGEPRVLSTVKSELISRMLDRALRCVDEMRAQEIANIVWACSILQARPSEAVLDALKAAASLHMRSFKPQEMGNFFWGLATMGEPPGKELLDGIRSRSVELMGDFERMDVSDILWSFATVGEHPGQEFLELVTKRAVEIVDRFDTHSTASLLWAYAVLGETPHGEALRVFCEHAIIVFSRRSDCEGDRSYEDQEEETLQILKTQVEPDLELGTGYNLRLRQVHQFILACELEGRLEGALQEMPLLALKDKLGSVSRKAFFDTRGTPSRLQLEVAGTLKSIGLKCEEEAVDPASGYQIDILVRVEDTSGESIGIAVEVDGPSHFLSASHQRLAKARGSTMFKRKQLELLGYKVVSVPYWEWRELLDVGSRVLYMKRHFARHGFDIQ